jgi:PAS domain S-box-containing protein
MATGRFVEVNDVFPAYYGFAREEIIGRTSVELEMWHDSKDRLEMVRRLAAGETVHNFERMARTRSGELFPVVISFEQTMIHGQRCVISVMQDLSARRRAENLTRAQMQALEMVAGGKPMKETLDELLRLMEAQAPDMIGSILLLEADGIHVRHGAAPSLPAEFIQAVDGSAIGPCAGSCGTAAFRREPVLVADIAIDPLWADYKHLALPHGLRACWSTPVFDAQKNLLGTFAIYRRTVGLPAEEHQQLIEMATHTAAICIGKNRDEQTLLQNELRLRLMAELIAGYSFAYTVTPDRRMQLEWMSAAGEKVLGYTEAELKSSVSFRDRIHPDDRHGQQASLNSVLAGIPEMMEFRFRTKSGGTRWLRCFNRPEWDAPGGRVIRILGAGQDITDLKAAEQERTAAVAGEQQARIQYTFQLIASQEAERKRIAGELHDSMGQNLLLIKNLAQLALRAPTQEHAGAINSLADQCLQEVRQISRDLHPHQLDHLGLKQALEVMLENAAQASAAKFLWKLEDTGEIFSADAAMNLYRVVQESLNNILKHSRAKNVRVQLERDVHEVVLEITDDGCGFTPAAPAGSEPGMGLKNIAERVRMLGGKLTMDSRAGAGTRICVTVPVAGEAA